jgi:hypothetical protein
MTLRKNIFKKGEIKMSFRISRQTGKTTYNLKEFTVDTYDDITKINKN